MLYVSLMKGSMGMVLNMLTVYTNARYIVPGEWTTAFKGHRQVLYRQQTDEASWPSNHAICMPRLKQKPQFTSAQELHHPATQVRRTRARLYHHGRNCLARWAGREPCSHEMGHKKFVELSKSRARFRRRQTPGGKEQSRRPEL